MSAPTEDRTRLLTEDQAAEYLGLPVVTLDLLRPLHVGPAAIRVGGRCCYRTADLDAWRARGDRRTELMAAIGVVVNTLHAVQVEFGETNVL